MSWDPEECNWEEFSRRLRANWVELTEEDLKAMRAKLDKLARLVLEHDVRVEAYVRGIRDERLAETRGRKNDSKLTRHGWPVWTKN